MFSVSGQEGRAIAGGDSAGLVWHDWQDFWHDWQDFWHDWQDLGHDWQDLGQLLSSIWVRSQSGKNRQEEII
jgi:hypothetical protein